MTASSCSEYPTMERKAWFDSTTNPSGRVTTMPTLAESKIARNRSSLCLRASSACFCWVMSSRIAIAPPTFPAPSCGGALPEGAVLLLPALGDQWDGAADDLVRGPPEDALGRGVPDEHDAVGIQRGDRGRRGLGERPERAFGRVGGQAHCCLPLNCAPPPP